MKTRHQRWHLRFWVALSVLLPALLVAALLQRQERPLEPVTDYLSLPAQEPAKGDTR